MSVQTTLHYHEKWAIPELDAVGEHVALLPTQL